jgi:hypothetical protein
MSELVKRGKIRSGPVYIETERGTVSLVFEAKADRSGRAAPKPDVYVIDGDGVRLVRRKNRLMLALAVGAIAFSLVLAISYLFRGKRTL